GGRQHPGGARGHGRHLRRPLLLPPRPPLGAVPRRLRRRVPGAPELAAGGEGRAGHLAGAGRGHGPQAGPDLPGDREFPPGVRLVAVLSATATLPLAAILLLLALPGGAQTPQAAPAPSVLDTNKAVVRRYIEEVLAGGDLKVLDTLVAPDYSDSSPGAEAGIG